MGGPLGGLGEPLGDLGSPREALRGALGVLCGTVEAVANRKGGPRGPKDQSSGTQLSRNAIGVIKNEGLTGSDLRGEAI